MLTVGSLCTGYGGMELGLRLAGVQAELAFVADPDPASAKLLALRHAGTPNLGDIWQVDWTRQPAVDIITAGYPCQPFSYAGHRQGVHDDRHLWPAVFAAVRDLRPRHVLLENVAGHLFLGFGDVLGDLASIGFDARWTCLRASDIGAAHRRDRVFIHAWPTGTHGSGGLTLLPTPRASEAAGAGTHGSGGLDLRTAASLLPTPRASERENRQTKRSPSQEAGTHGLSLRAEVCSLLPTPRATDGTKGGPRQRGSSGDLMLPSAVVQHLPVPVPVPVPVTGTAQPGRWGQYGTAVARWERITGMRAPEPTEPGRNGPRLAAPFVEWLMGLDAGWVTDVPGLTRNEMLRLLGNGIVRHQAAAAIRELVAR